MSKRKPPPAGLMRMVLLLAAIALIGDAVLWLVWFLVVCAVLCVLTLFLLVYKLGFSLAFTKLAVMVGQVFLAVSVCVGLAVACLFVFAFGVIVIQRWLFRAARRGTQRGLEWKLKVMVRLVFNT
jgi:hypothetical protein